MVIASSSIYPVGPPLGNLSNGIFGTDGIRGKVGKVLTPALALQVGYWCNHVLTQRGPVLIGQDSRLSGDMITAALTAGLSAAGREVWSIGLCPTPAIAHLIKTLGASGGLMVSASHNPPEDNGIKIFDSTGEKINSKKQLLLESKLKGELSNGKVIPIYSGFGKTYQRHELLKTYREWLLESVSGKNLKGIKIVLDLCWGSATSCGAEVFEELGAEVTVLHGQPDGAKINLNCGSTQLTPLRKAVLEKDAEMGFAFDGDSDRMMAVDAKGRVIDGDHVLYLWGANLQDHGQLPENRLVATVMSNLGFERAWKQRGGLLERTQVGDKNVHAAMVASQAALGGEQSGHILSAAHGLSGDGLLTALQLAAICHEEDRTMSQWLDTSFKAFPQKLANISIPNNITNLSDWKKCEPIKEAVIKAEAAMGEDGRVLLRASGTEPLLRVMVEAKEQEIVDSWTSHLAGLVAHHLEAA